MLEVYVYRRIFIKRTLKLYDHIFVDEIHMSQGYLPELGCRLLSLLL